MVWLLLGGFHICSMQCLIFCFSDGAPLGVEGGYSGSNRSPDSSRRVDCPSQLAAQAGLPIKVGSFANGAYLVPITR